MTYLKSICAFSLIMFAVSLQAQNGEIAGKIVDRNGEGIAKAKVSIADNMGAVIGKETVTDLDGNYSLKPLPPGKYNLLITAKDCTTQAHKGVIVSSDKSTFIDTHLDCAPPQKKSHKRQRK